MTLEGSKSSLSKRPRTSLTWFTMVVPGKNKGCLPWDNKKGSSKREELTPNLWVLQGKSDGKYLAWLFLTWRNCFKFNLKIPYENSSKVDLEEPVWLIFRLVTILMQWLHPCCNHVCTSERKHWHIQLFVWYSCRFFQSKLE